MKSIFRMNENDLEAEFGNFRQVKIPVVQKKLLSYVHKWNEHTGNELANVHMVWGCSNCKSDTQLAQ